MADKNLKTMIFMMSKGKPNKKGMDTSKKGMPMDMPQEETDMPAEKAQDKKDGETEPDDNLSKAFKAKSTFGKKKKKKFEGSPAEEKLEQNGKRPKEADDK